LPGARPLYSAGESHGSGSTTPFSEHSKVASGSSEEKLTFASVKPVTAGGPKSIVVVGAVSSTTSHVYVAGVCSTIALGLKTWTCSVWLPRIRPL
jgi:hypothetical protein